MITTALPKTVWAATPRCSTATWCSITCATTLTGGKAPEQMIDPNTRTDYNKMKKLIQLDRLDGDRKGVLRRITEEGRIVADFGDHLSRP